MEQQFVLLASGLKPSVTIANLKTLALFYEPFPNFIGLEDGLGRHILDNIEIETYQLDANDGGNGGGGGYAGGGAQKVKQSSLKYSFWRFAQPSVYAAPQPTTDEKFPNRIRYEICLTFTSFGELNVFWGSEPGKAIESSFDFVQYVAVTNKKDPAVAVANANVQTVDTSDDETAHSDGAN